MRTTCSRMLWVLSCWVAWTVALEADAQDRFDVESADTVPATEGSVVTVWGGRTLETGRYSLAISGTYARKPLSIEAESGDHLGDLVGSIGTLQFMGAVGVFEKVDVGIAIPMHRVSAGSDYATTPPPALQSATLTESEVALGDIRIAPRVSLLQHAGRSGVDFAVIGQLWLPTGSDSAYAGESLRVEPRLALDYHSDTVLLAFNAGYLVRGEAHVLGSDLDDQVRLAAGADVGLGKGFSLLGEFGMHLNVLASEFGDEDIASEALAGVRYRTKGWIAQLGAGPGVIRGLSGPLYRVFASFGYSGEPRKEVLDSDFDELLDDADRCIRDPEDKDRFQDEDGCPDLDNDQDGVADAADRCGVDPEDRDGFRDDDGCPDADNDEDGLADANDRCPIEAEDQDGFQDEDGCSDPDNDQDAIADAQDRCPLEPGVPEQQGCPAAVPAAIVVTESKIELKESIHFGNDNAEIQPESMPLVDSIAQVMQSHKEIELVAIEGHTDGRGGKAHNQKLSEARANAVMTAITSRGVDPARLRAVGYGPSRPIAPNDTPENRAKNRRVELNIERRSSTAR